MMDFDPIEVSLAAESGLSRGRNDPLASFRCSSEGQRKFLTLLRDNEVYARTGNQGGKTLVGAVAGVAISRGVGEVDGIRLPIVQTPSVGAVLLKSKQQGVESAVKAYLEVIGDWPHHVAYTNSGLGHVGFLYIRPNGHVSDDHKTWSKVMFLSEDGEFPVGLRLDWVHADEPPNESVWRELRLRGRANRPFIRFITATPLKRQDWEWLRKEYEGCAESPRSGRVEVRWTIYDNTALSTDHINKIEQDLENDPLKEARLRGDYIDTSGMCPFDFKTLQEWRKRCVPPIRREPVDGARYESQLEVWHDPDATDEYLVCMDPSAGVEGADRCGLWVVSKRRRAGVARFFGYLSAYDLGRLGRKMCEKYNGAMAVPEMNGGFGEALLIGLDGWRNIYYGEHYDKINGTRSNRIGWFTTTTSKGTLITALQRATKMDDFYVPSADAVESLLGIVMDDQQKVVRYAGQNHEDMILIGLGAHITEQVPVRNVRPERTNAYVPFQELIRKSLGLRANPKVRRFSTKEAWR